MKNNQHLADKPVPVWQRVVGYINIFLLTFYSMLPGSVAAYELITDGFIATEINSNPQFELSNKREFLAEKAYYVTDTSSTSAQTITSFHQKLLAQRKSSLPAPTMIPIMNGDITIIIPHYPLEKLIGDSFVQSRFIRSQIYNQLNRNLLNDGFSNEAAQINELYNKAYTFSASSPKKFGDTLTAADTANFAHNFIWPELRTINGQNVLVPIVHLTEATINAQKIVGNTIEFLGDVTNFNTVTINAGTVNLRRNSLLKVVNDLNINEGGALKASHDLNVIVGGTLQNISGQLTAENNVNIIAGQYIQKTMVHRYATPTTQGTRLGQIASVNAPNGNISIKTANDIQVAGGTLSGNNITLDAGGDIRLTSQETTYVRNEVINGWTENTSVVEQLHSELSAEQSVKLIAAGAIEIDTTNIHADQGIIEILAGQGIYIVDSQNQLQSQRHGEWGRTTKQEQVFQSIAMRSALSAGQGIVIATDFGDINLRATELTSTTGTNISAHNGAVNFLLTKEQDNYFYNEVVEGFWKIKTTTQQDNVETAVYNEIIGGVKVHATHGMTLELAQYEDGDVATGINTITSEISAQLKELNEALADAKEDGLSTASLEAQIQEKSDELLQEQLSQLAETESLAWMQTLHNDPEYTDNFNLVYKELVELHKFDRTSNLSPGAMAIIAIAMAVVMGPGAGLIGSGGTIGSTTILGFNISAAAMQAGALSIATQAATGLASGQGLENTIKSLYHSDNIKATATAMVTAGVLDKYKDSLTYFDNLPEGDFSSLNFGQKLQTLTNQSLQAVGNAAIKTSISTVINGGDLSGFKEQFLQSLKAAAINEIGSQLANEIGEATKNGNINEAVRYLAHAALGCTIGVASASSNNSENSNGLSCASGAGGAVVGELIADSYKDQNEYDTKVGQIEDKLKELGIDSSKYQNLTEQEQRNLLKSRSTIALIKEVQQIKATGVDLAKLGAGLAALAAEADVNIAASTAENAAENNAFWFAIQAAYLLYKAYDLYQTIEGITVLGEQLAAAKDDPNEQLRLIEEFAISLGIDFIIGKSLSKGLERIAEYAKKTDIGKTVVDELQHLATLAEEGKLGSYKAGGGQGNKLEALPDTKERSTSDAILEGKEKSVKATASGNVNQCKVKGSQCALAVSDDIQADIDKFSTDYPNLSNQEKGRISEGIVNDVLAKDPNIEVINATYNGGTNGIDHLFIIKDNAGNTRLTVMLDSKQFKADNSVSLSKGAGGHTQLTNEWTDTVISKLDPIADASAISAINTARDSGTLLKGITAINRNTNQLYFVPIKSHNDPD